jgi:hypothetical protein
MWDNLYLFVVAFWPKWVAVVSAFALFAVEPMAKAYWPWLAKQLGKLSEKTKTRLEVGIVIIAVFYAGFSSWSDEHTAKVKAEGDRATAIGERDEARRFTATPSQQVTINTLSGDLTNARGRIDEQKGTISKLQTELDATKGHLATMQTLYAARHLSEQEKQAIQQNAKVPADEKYSFSLFQPPDCRDCNEYSTEFIEALAAAGWKVTLFTTMHGGINPRFRGIALIVKDATKPPKSAIALANALAAATIRFSSQQQSGNIQIGDDDVGIVIGPKEGQ